MKNQNPKQKISITLDEETLKLLEDALKGNSFRNRSHAIEFSINEILKQKIKQGEKGK